MFPRALATQGCRLPARAVTYKHPDAPSRHFFEKTGLQANGEFYPTGSRPPGPRGTSGFATPERVTATLPVTSA